MIQFMRVLAAMLLAGFLAACGGGGGSPGATTGNGGTSGGGTGGGTTTPSPTVTVSLVDGAGVSTSVVTSSKSTFARATVTDSAGQKVAGTVVTFTSDASLVKFVPSSGSALTDANGVASVQVLPASATAAGAGTVTADVLVGGKAATGSVSFQVPQTTADSPSARVADFALYLDRNTLANAGTNTAKLTVVAVDSSNNVVPGAAVTVSTDKNSVYMPNGTATDSNGTYTGQVGIGADRTDRTITATVTVNNKTKTTSFNVIGSRITLQSAPSAPAPGQSGTATASVTDSAGNPIANVPVTFTGTVPGLQGQVVNTNATGQATKSFVAPTTAGVYTIGASGSGVIAADYQLQVFSSAVPVATIPAGAVPSLAASPNVLSVNAPGSTASRSSLRFLFLDGQNQPVQNVRVRFVDVTTGLPAVGASISSGSSTLYTDASGTVTAQYIAGQNSSPTNGVTVRACYSAGDFASAGDCPNKVDATLTVAGQALAISIGDDNLLTKGPGTYIKRFAVTVADAAGRAVPNAPVDISVDLTHYGKGNFGQSIPPVPLSLTQSYPDATTAPTSSRVWCANEDINRNGNVDPGENINGSVDTNGQPTLEPRKADLIVSYDDPSVTTTNSSGVLVIKVEYSQRFATWLAYKVRVTASVAGSQGMAERLFITDALQDDLENGSFLLPAYGYGSCSQPN